jgi:hypothetical protein
VKAGAPVSNTILSTAALELKRIDVVTVCDDVNVAVPVGTEPDDQLVPMFQLAGAAAVLIQLAS